MDNLKCPYCGSDAHLVDSFIIYNGRSYGWAYVCGKFPECDAYVGCHPSTKTPLGRLANKELRTLKTQVHRAFDPLWIRKAQKTRCSKRQARKTGYRWLAKQLGIAFDECHVGMFDEETCRRTLKILSTVGIHAGGRGMRSKDPGAGSNLVSAG